MSCTYIQSMMLPILSQNFIQISLFQSFSIEKSQVFGISSTKILQHIHRRNQNVLILSNDICMICFNWILASLKCWMRHQLLFYMGNLIFVVTINFFLHFIWNSDLVITICVRSVTSAFITLDVVFSLINLILHEVMLWKWSWYLHLNPLI